MSKKALEGGIPSRTQGKITETGSPDRLSSWELSKKSVQALVFWIGFLVLWAGFSSPLSTFIAGYVYAKGSTNKR